MSPGWLEFDPGWSYSLQGLAFFALGVAALVTMSRDQEGYLATHSGWLGAFGILFGLQAFVEGERLHNPASWLTVLSMILLVSAFAPLLEFGRRLWNQGSRAFDLAALPLYGLAGLGTVGLMFASPVASAGLELGARYLLGVPGAALAGVGLLTRVRAIPGAPDTRGTCLWLRGAAFAMLVYAALTLFLAPGSGRVLTDWLPTSTDFLAATGLPVQWILVLCATALAVSLVRFDRHVHSMSTATLRRVTDNLHGFVYRSRNDRHWTVTFMSEGGEILTGYPAETFLRGEVHFADLIHPEDRDWVWGAVQTALAASRTFQLEYRIVDRHGALHWCYEEGRGIFDGGGALLYLEGYVRGDDERRRAESDRRQMQALVEASAQPVAWVDADGRLRYWNAALRTLLAVPAEADASAYRIHDFHDADGREALDSSVCPTVIQRGTWVGEIDMRTLDGQRIPTLLSVFGMRDEVSGGQVFGAVITDLSEIRRAERELRIKDAAMATSKSAIAMTDPDGVLTYVNQAFLDLWGLDGPEDAHGRPVVEFWEEPGQAQAVIDTLRQSGGWRGDLRARLADGSIADIELTAHLVRGRDGEPVCMMGSFIDVTERNRVQRSLEHERDFARNLLDTAPVLVLLMDPLGRIRHVNRYFEQLTGYRLHEVEGKDWFSGFLPERERERVRAVFQATAGGQSARGYINPIVARDGSEREIEWNDSPLYDGSGALTGVLAVGMDVTERRALDARARALQQLADESPQPIGWASIDGDVRYLNKAFRRAMAVPEEVEDSEYQVRDFYAPDTFALLATRYMPAAAARGHWVGELEITALDGRVVPTIHSIFCLRDDDGEANALAVVITDLSDLKRAQTALAESESRYRQLFELSNDGIVYADVGSRELVAVNPAFLELLGLEGDDVPSLSVQDIHPRDALPRVLTKFNELASGHIKLARDIPVLRRDGSIFYADVTASRVALEGRWVLAGIFRDVSERRDESQRILDLNQTLETRVRERTVELERASAAKSEFLSRMSHELRTPLNAILGFTQILQLPGERSLDEQQAENVQEIRHAGEHLLALVNEVLDLARIENGKLELQPEPLDLAPVIRHAAAQIEAVAREREIHVELSLHDACGVLADSMRVNQVLLNLLSNAVKYNRNGGTVEVTCEALSKNERVRVSVHDTGPGLSAEQQGKLFRPFERLESPYTGIEGTGIGLALAKRLVDNMQGEIGVESTPGEGSTFWFELPQSSEMVLEADDAPAPTPVPATAPEPTRRHKVLYVEDDPANLRLVDKLIAQRGDLELLAARSAEEGVELAMRERPDLILLDLNLPGMDGFEALERLRAESATRVIPVVAVTANAMPRDVERGKAAGFADYLTKPLDIRTFFRIIESHLEG